jgi:hypothetical protein
MLTLLTPSYKLLLLEIGYSIWSKQFSCLLRVLSEKPLKTLSDDMGTAADASSMQAASVGSRSIKSADAA